MYFVISCFNEQESLPLFFEAVKDVKDKMNDVSVRFIFVNDGSRDNTLGLLRDYAEKYDYVKYISFSRNFGKRSRHACRYEDVGRRICRNFGR